MDMNIDLLCDPARNTRGIPVANYIDAIGPFLKKFGGNVKEALNGLEELLQKYDFMRAQFEKQRAQCNASIPEIQSNLEALEALAKQKEEGEQMLFRYPLSDTVYSKAQVNTDGKVRVDLNDCAD
ncbi:prefoldin subunit 3 [Kipferlia bialata]|uniref:Prefoldin subunit 3 n=1 Tax=Kipferlia bialata TaxID=797122 RepID=A0A9K3D0L2_9EUKA|nr:prefoldin subunit 3 [Kipferlia bialata]|eukprot:g6683.t1